MAVRRTTWIAGDAEQQGRISQEVRQLRQMSKTLRTTAMRSFMKRSAAIHPDIDRTKVSAKTKARAKPTSIAA